MLWSSIGSSAVHHWNGFMVLIWMAGAPMIPVLMDIIYSLVPLKLDFLGAWKSAWLKSNLAFPVIFSLVYIEKLPWQKIQLKQDPPVVGRCSLIICGKSYCILLTQCSYHISLISLSGTWYVQADWQVAKLVSLEGPGMACTLGGTGACYVIWGGTLSAFLPIMMNVWGHELTRAT